MADIVYSSIGSFTLAESRALCSIDPVFSKLTESQQNIVINQATKELASMLNKEDYDFYKFDSIGDGDLVLAPTASGLSNIYDQYGQLKFPLYSGGVVGVALTSVAVGMTLTSAELSLVSHSGLAAYTIIFDEAVIDGNTEIYPSTPNAAEISIADTNEILVIASLNHPAFSIYIKNWKES